MCRGIFFFFCQATPRPDETELLTEFIVDLLLRCESMPELAGSILRVLAGGSCRHCIGSCDCSCGSRKAGISRPGGRCDGWIPMALACRDRLCH
mmetsp:Transcript_116564/g.341121  ORF Transcript_116564/g.341121 Transcript_116564/m.341121 type:complete len:94 (+) Transcript_116564:1313-1594(+)